MRHNWEQQEAQGCICDIKIPNAERKLAELDISGDASHTSAVSVAGGPELQNYVTGQQSLDVYFLLFFFLKFQR
jgi:hypothetical protein